MLETERHAPGHPISQEVMVAVLERCDQTREFMVQMWLQNPELARQAGARIAELLSPLSQKSAT